jgi:hypothetical protein
MRLYHGSSKVLDVLKPQKAKGISEFENIKGVFLTKTFLHAALYAIGKGLKGKTIFGVSENKLIMVGGLRLKHGFVYEVNVKNPIKGQRGQYVSKGEVQPLTRIKVYPRDYAENIIRVKDKKGLLEFLRI